MKKLVTEEWRLLLFGFLMMFWSSPGQTFFFSLFGAEIRHAFDLTHGEFGGVYAAATLASAIVLIWSGPLADRVALRRFSMLAVSGLAVGCLVLSMGSGVAMLLLGIFMLRHFGQALMTLISSTAMVRYLDAYRGKASALSKMGYACSEALLPAVVIFFIAWVGWRATWQVTAGVMVLLMLPAIVWLLRGHDHRHSAYLRHLAGLEVDDNDVKVRKQWTRKEVVGDIRFYLLIPALLAQPFLFTGFIFHQVHLVEVKGWTMAYWGNLFALYATVSVACTLVSGWLIDRYSALALVPFMTLPMGAGLLLLVFFDSELVAALFMVLTGVTVGGASPVYGPVWAELYGSRHLASIKSLSTTLMVLFTAASPLIIGALVDFGISIEVVVAGGAVYVLVTSILARQGCRMAST